MTTSSSAPGRRTFVLVPGVWHGGWAWEPVARRLRAAGHHAVPLTMPGMGDGTDPGSVGLGDAVAHVVSEVQRRDLRDVVLVGHSWGGVPVTGAAHRLGDRVAGVVYCSAFVPVQGESLNDGQPPEAGEYERQLIAASPDGSFLIPFEPFAALFMPDEPEPVQRFVHGLLSAQPGRYTLDAVDFPSLRGTGIPASYLLARDDRALARPGAELAARAGVEPVLVPGGHEFLLTHPDELAAALLAA